MWIHMGCCAYVCPQCPGSDLEQPGDHISGKWMCHGGQN